MPANIIIPSQPKPIVSNYQSFPSYFSSMPKEGPRTIPFSVVWITDGPVVEFNSTQQQINQITQIVSIYVDNINCGVDVKLVFPDTQFEIDIPAYSEGIYPVITAQRRFYGIVTNPVSGDTTFFNVLNHYPFPIQTEKTIFQTNASSVATTFVAGTTALVGQSGTLRALALSYSIFGSSTAIEFSLQDASSNQLWNGYAGGDAFVINGLLANLTGLDLRFSGSLSSILTVTGAPTGGYALNAYWSTP